jgi:hypothetical protein
MKLPEWMTGRGGVVVMLMGTPRHGISARGGVAETRVLTARRSRDGFAGLRGVD